MKNDLLVTCTEFETRMAILEDDRLVELQVEKSDADRLVGDIYKGVIKTVLPVSGSIRGDSNKSPAKASLTN